MNIEFTKNHEKYKQGDVIKVSQSVAKVLILMNLAKKHLEPKKRGRPRKNTYQTRVIKAE